VKRQRAATNEGRASGVDVMGGSSYRCCAWGKSWEAEAEEAEAWAARREGSVEARL
jgi:hypothetical protein